MFLSRGIGGRYFIGDANDWLSIGFLTAPSCLDCIMMNPSSVRIDFEVEVSGKSFVDIEPDELETVDIEWLMELMREEIKFTIKPNIDHVGLLILAVNNNKNRVDKE